MSVLLLASLAVGLLALWLWERQRRLRLARDLHEASAARSGMIRLLRLAAGEMRGHGLRMLGYTAHFEGEPAEVLAGIAASLARVSNDLIEQTEDAKASRRLHDETIALGGLVDLAIAQTVAALGLGRRAWRVAPAVDAITLRADHRALHEVVSRVLARAANTTRDGDWIDIAVADRGGDWALIIEDEGAGIATPPAEANGPESRGIGYGLTLARGLMQAHGGALLLESAAQVGTRVALVLPAWRIVQAAPKPAGHAAS